MAELKDILAFFFLALCIIFTLANGAEWFFLLGIVFSVIILIFPWGIAAKEIKRKRSEMQMTYNYPRQFAVWSLLLLAFCFGGATIFALKDVVKTYASPSGSAIAALVLGFSASAYCLYVLMRENTVSEKGGNRR